MKSKKILWIAILLVVIVGVVIVLLTVKPREDTVATNTLPNKISNSTSQTETVTKKSETTKTKLNDGVLYSLTNEEVKADIVIGDNYFDTQINDMMINYDSYKNKKIEVEGMYLEGEPYTFVGRFSTSNLCAYCPTGYSYIEYEWNGEKLPLETELTWMKVIGTLEKGNDGMQDYYYLKVLTLEIMNKPGQLTVNN